MSRRSRRRTATTNALLRFGPEQDVLRAAIRQAYQNRHTSVKSARGQARGVIQAVADTMPAAKAIYGQQGEAQQRALDVFGADVAGLSGVADSIKAGAALERQNATDSLSQARSATLTGLTRQRTAALEGRQFAVAKARDQFVSDISDVLRQKQSLAQRKGAFVTSEIARLAEDAADRRIDLRKISETGRHNRASERTAAKNADTAATRAANAGKDGKDKRFDASHDDYDQAASQISKALAAAKLLDPDSSPSERIHIAQLLASGSKSQPIYETDATGKRVPKLKNGVPLKTPEVPQIDQLWITAALDQYYLGGVSRTTARKLRKAGYRVRRLPVSPHMRKDPFRKGASGKVNAGAGAGARN